MEQSGTLPRCNTKTRAWCFTLNNYTEEDIKFLEQIFKINEYEYIFGEEKGKNETPHLQGTFRAKNPIYFNSVKNMIPKAHIEKCKSWNASKKYCSKDGIIHTNLESIGSEYDKYMEKKYTNVIWKPWQQEVLGTLNTEPDERTINWYYEENGNTGKSFLAKYIDWKHPTIIVNGKQSDIFNGIKSFLTEEKKYPKVIIIDIPRTNQNYVCYSTMEKIKDGIFYSGKYEGGKIRMLPCHLFVFANFEPKYDALSIDRWNIKKI